jgi:hypothetical protein
MAPQISRVGISRSGLPASAGRQADEIDGEGHLGGLVEVVYAPHQAAVLVPPGAEVLQMDVADGKGGRCLRQVRADLEDGFGPAPKGAAQEDERALCHLLVLARQVLLDHLAAQLLAHPAFIGAYGLLNVRHGCLTRHTFFAL